MMTETTIRVGLKELSTLRIKCKRNGCAGVVEVPMERLSSVSSRVECPVCRECFLGDHSQSNAFSNLAQALQRFDECPLELEFPVRLGGKDS